MSFDSQLRAATGGKRKLPWRYRWHDAVHDKVLARLLALNAERYAEEANLRLRAGGRSRASANGAGGPCRRYWADRTGPMTTALAPNQLEAIASSCRRHRVARLHAFGSVVGPDFRPGESDIDLLVEFQPDEPGALYKTYFSLLNELRQSLSARIDLVMVEAIRNPYVKASIEASKQEIYAA